MPQENAQIVHSLAIFATHLQFVLVALMGIFISIHPLVVRQPALHLVLGLIESAKLA